MQKQKTKQNQKKLGFKVMCFEYQHIRISIYNILPLKEADNQHLIVE